MHFGRWISEERQRFWRHRQYPTPCRGQHNGVSPDLFASITCHGALYGDGIARLQRILIPRASFQLQLAFQLDRPADWLCGIWNVHQDMHMRIGPIHARHDSFESCSLVRIELGGNRTLCRHRRTIR